jgi:glucosyl-dolichyl phosphate glucuronosyltransferase
MPRGRTPRGRPKERRRIRERLQPRPKANLRLIGPGYCWDPTRAMSPTATVLICTYNRAEALGEALDSLARMTVSPGVTWDVLVVDNSSTDDTAAVVRQRQAAFPVPLHYLYEPRQGKSYALNTGLAAGRSAFVVFTDDDVVVAPGWLQAAIAPMLADSSIDYTGGPVSPIWEAPRPRWLDPARGDLWGTIAILDYGPSPFVFEERQRVPLGANMAVRRALIDSVGGFDPAFGRTGTSLLGQEQAEFFCRTHAHGARGLYAPDMKLHHHVPARRLTRQYFRRWWFCKGISRSRLHRIHPRSAGTDLSTAKRVAGVPLFALRAMARHFVEGVARLLLRRDVIGATRHEMMLVYYAGFAWEDWRFARSSRPTGSPSRLSPTHQGTPE